MNLFVLTSRYENDEYNNLNTMNLFFNFFYYNTVILFFRHYNIFLVIHKKFECYIILLVVHKKDNIIHECCIIFLVVHKKMTLFMTNIIKISTSISMKYRLYNKLI